MSCLLTHVKRSDLQPVCRMIEQLKAAQIPARRLAAKSGDEAPDWVVGRMYAVTSLTHGRSPSPSYFQSPTVHTHNASIPCGQMGLDSQLQV